MYISIKHLHFKSTLLSAIAFLFLATLTFGQGTRLLRQPTLSSTHIAFTYGGDVWVTDLSNQKTLRLTSTPAVESNPHFSPDGKWIAFSSNRSGNTAVYIVSVEGGTPKRLTWHPSAAFARGWSSDGKRVLYGSSRDSAPSGYDHLWTVSVEGGPSTMITRQWGFDGSYSPDGKQIVIDRVDRWDVEWRNYRGGQNSPLVILNLTDQTEKLLPNESTMDIQPLWLGDKIYFLSDRDWTTNIWSYTVASGELKEVTNVTGSDIKWLAGNGNKLAFEREGYLHLLDLSTNQSTQMNITINADFPWAEAKWEDVTKSMNSVAISPTGKRVIMESRGEIFTAPVEFGDARNMTQTSGVADRAPIWSPKGNELAWFSDADGKGYALNIATQDGLSKSRSISIGESKMAWEPTWSPDGKLIAFADDDVRVRVMTLLREQVRQ